MPFMLPFRKHPTDAAYIGRIIAGYGHIEFVLGWTIGLALASKRKPTPKQAWLLEHRTHYEKVGLQVIYTTQGAERRLKRARSITRPAFEKFGMKDVLYEVLNEINECRAVRNLLAHSVYDWSSFGLYLSSLERAAKRPGILKYELQNVPRESLKEIERFCWTTLRRQEALNQIFAVKAGLSLPPAPSMPKRPAALRGHTSLFPLRNTS